MTNKESIRLKIDEAKAKINEAFAAEEVPPGIKVAVESLIVVLDIVITVLLEKKTRKNSSNSGLPPSRNNGSNGNRNNSHNNDDRNKKGSQLKNTRTEKTSETVSPKECHKCGANLSHVKVTKTESRKKIDIIYEIVEHTVIAEVKKCTKCGHETKGKFPQGMDGKVQYGLGIKASIVNFLVVQMLSLDRVSEHFKGLIGRFISQAVMLKYISQFSESLAEWEAIQIQNILKSPVIYCDETSLRVNKKKQWIHSYSYGDITLKFLHEKRGIKAIEDINIIPKYGGTIVHDSWSSYLFYDNVQHGLCGAHLLRELKFIEDSTKNKWATKMKKLLQEVAQAISEKETNILTLKEYRSLQSRYRNILTRAKKELPEFPKRDGKRGRIKHTEAQNLWLRFKKYEKSILLFTTVKEVDFTNNRAERDLRDTKLKQKVSGTFRTAKYARHFVRISSFVKSMRYKGYSSLEAIMMAMQGDILI